MQSTFIFDQNTGLNYPSVAIVILNYNGVQFLNRFLPAVFSSVYPNKKIIVADNASTDDSIKLLNENFKEAELIIFEKNYGFAEGYNRALENVEADYFVLLNSDVEVTENWIKPVIDLMESDLSIAACQPKILSFNNPKQFEYAGACGGWIDRFGYPFARGRVFENCEMDMGQYETPMQVFWATGAAMFVKKNIWKEVGGFDGFFFAHQEEIDLCWRLQNNGYKIYCCPQSVVYHVGGGTLPQKSSMKTFLNFRNNNIMLFKNLPLQEKIWKIPFRLLLDIVFAIKSLIFGDTASIAAVGKAHFAVLKWVFMKKGKNSLKSKPTNKLIGIYKGSVVWDYFIKNKKRFPEIVNN